MQFSLCETVWKFHSISITQNLREVDFGDYRSTKSTILTNLEALNIEFFLILHFLKAEGYQCNKIQNP